MNAILIKATDEISIVTLEEAEAKALVATLRRDMAFLMPAK